MAQAKAQLISEGALSTQRVLRRPRPTILIAEDSADSLEMMRTLLGFKGYQVLSAQNGLEAVDLALANFPDLILIDLQLPKLDGLNVTRNLRRHPRLREVPIVVLSGYDPADHRQQAIDAGCTDYLLKPIDFEKLDAILNRIPVDK